MHISDIDIHQKPVYNKGVRRGKEKESPPKERKQDNEGNLHPRLLHRRLLQEDPGEDERCDLHELRYYLFQLLRKLHPDRPGRSQEQEGTPGNVLLLRPVPCSEAVTKNDTEPGAANPRQKATAGINPLFSLKKRKRVPMNSY